jgi:NADPH-ferrihemoprotein reductase
MGSAIWDTLALPPVLQQVSKAFKPTSTIDMVVLILAGFVAAAYLLRGIAWDRPDPYYHTYFERPQAQMGVANSQGHTQRDISKKLAETDKGAVIFWGSQSGTAERFANQLAKECQVRFGLGALSADLSDYDPESIAQLSNGQIAIFILSTYGEGDPSDNTSGFWDWVNRDSPLALSNLRFAAFGLGNSNYKYYNRVVDVAVQCLSKSGAKLLLPVGKADDAERSTEEDFLAWKDELFGVFRRDFGLEEKMVEFQSTIVGTEDESLELIDLHHGEPAHSRDNPRAAAACSPIRALTVKNAKELFNSSTRNCVHMELDLSEYPELHYKTGDHLAVWPSNPTSEVDLLLTSMHLQQRQDVPMSFKSLDPAVKVPIPTPTTIRALFSRYLEICAPLSRSLIQGLASFAPSPEAREFVLKLGQDKESYSEYLRHTQLTLGRVLSLASPSEPWSNLPISYLIELLPLSQPRYYSISSSSVISPRRACVTALIAVDPLPANKRQNIYGVTSNYLLALSKQHGQLSDPKLALPSSAVIEYDLSGPGNALQGTRLYAHIRKSKFKLPVQSTCPIIMVAAGTGLAPFRAFIAERVKLHAIAKPIGEMVLFFGCRRPEEDFLYREELEAMQASVGREKVLLKIVTAFSRVEGQEKVYVQQRVKEYGNEVLGLIEEKGASFYICGRASMAREVGFSVGEVVKETKGWTDAQVKEWSEGLKRKGKWREDVWG